MANSLPRLWAVIKREYMERVRTKWFIISTLLIPLLLGATSVLPVWLAMKTAASSDVGHVAIIDATGTDLGLRVSRVLAGDSARASNANASGAGAPEVRVVAPDGVAQAESLATHEVMQRGLPGYLVLDAATVRGERARYAGRNASSVPDLERLRTAVRQSIIAQRLAGAGLDGPRVDSLTQVKLQLPAERISDKGRGGGGGIRSYIVGLVISFVLYISLAIYGQMVLRGVMEEKTTRVAEVVVSSVKPEVLMIGKVLGVAGVGLTQMALWALGAFYIMSMLVPIVQKMGSKGAAAAVASNPANASAAAAASLPLPTFSVGTVIAIAVFFLLGFLLFSSLYAAAGATVSSEQDAQQAATPIAFLLVPSAILVQPIALNPASTMAQIFSWIPFTAPVIMPLRMTMIQVPWWEVAGSIGVTLVTCALTLWVAARIYRVGLLMYGKRPSIGEIARWVRQAA
jgi:ABC-2 type transport system permease protein